MTSLDTRGDLVGYDEWADLGSREVLDRISIEVHHGRRRECRLHLDGDAIIETSFISVDELPEQFQQSIKHWEDVAAVRVRGTVEGGQDAGTEYDAFIVVSLGYGEPSLSIRYERSRYTGIADVALTAEVLRTAVQIADNVRVEIERAS